MQEFDEKLSSVSSCSNSSSKSSVVNTKMGTFWNNNFFSAIFCAQEGLVKERVLHD